MSSFGGALGANESSAEAVAHFDLAVRSGQHWYLALLDALGRWTLPEELHEGRRYCYLIEGEAFDWLLLTERLCAAVSDPLPASEVERLLFRGQPPIEVSEEEFRQRLGPMKAWAYLNYFYGVTVEEAVLLAMEDALWKEHGHRSTPTTAARIAAEAFERLYGETRSEMLHRFQREKGYRQVEALAFQEWKEFTYWLFRQRVRSFNKPRVASDTKRGLETLFRHRNAALKSGDPVDEVFTQEYAELLEVSARKA